jgi:hypothetical protein
LPQGSASQPVEPAPEPSALVINTLVRRSTEEVGSANRQRLCQSNSYVVQIHSSVLSSSTLLFEFSEEDQEADSPLSEVENPLGPPSSAISRIEKNRMSLKHCLQLLVLTKYGSSRT